MSTRRAVGDRVWLRPGAGFYASRGEWGTIVGWTFGVHGDDEALPCELDCGDPHCREWNDVELDSGRFAYHVAECEMFNEPQLER